MVYRSNPVSILYKATAGRYRPVRVADGPITARYIFIKNASWEVKTYTNLPPKIHFHSTIQAASLDFKFKLILYRVYY